MMIMVVVMVLVIMMCILSRRVLLHTSLRRGKRQPNGEDEADVEEEVFVAET